MIYNNITFPGNFFIRIIRWFFKRKKLYKIPNISNSQKKITYAIEVKKKCSKKLSSIYKEVLKFDNIDIYVHGSWADNTKTAFSDLDDFLIINDYSLSKKKLVSLIKALNTIDMRFCRIDPLQHHGHWIIGKSELLDYDNSFLPLHILKNSCVVKGKNKISAHINDKISKDGLFKNIKNTIAEIEKLYVKLLNNNINVFELKALIGSFLILPAYVFQHKGYNFDKPMAIKNVDKIYSKESIEFITMACKCRTEWKNVTNLLSYKFFALFVYCFYNPHLWRIFALKFSPKINAKKMFNLHLSKTKLINFINENLQHVQ